MTEHMEKATQNLMQICEELHTLSRAAVDANLRSITAAAKGWDESSKNATSIVQENLSRALNAGKIMAEAKSVQDVFTMHQDFFKDCMNVWMAGANRMQDISTRTAKDVVEPVAQHTNDAISRIMQKSRMAA